MNRLRWVLLLLLLGGLTAAQEAEDEENPDEEDDGIEITEGGEVAPDGTLDIVIDPFEEQAPAPDEPNRPEPVQIGSWPVPELDDAARRERDELLRLRAERAGDVGVRYRLAEFYLTHRWYPQAEQEFLACAQLDPESIRPWEGLLRVYRSRPHRLSDEERLRRAMAGAGVGIVLLGDPQEDELDWLPSEEERNRRITHAYAELIRRRPDDVARRRESVQHLKRVRDDVRLVPEARAILERLPDDADTRYDLAEALRRIAAREEKREEGAGAARMAEARTLLERNLERAPDHARSALRLARILAAQDGAKAQERIVALESRALFRLFIREEIADVAFRPDTWRMVRDLVSPSMARSLWNSALMPDWYRDRGFNPFRDDSIYYRPWIFVGFPHDHPRDVLPVIESLGMVPARDAAGVLLSYLWHLAGPDAWGDDLRRREQQEQLEKAAIAAAERLGGACYTMAEAYLRQADTPDRRRRAVALMRGLKDPRSVGPLVDALAWDRADSVSLGVARGLEELGDPAAIDGLVEAALDPSRPKDRRAEAVEALARFRDPRCIEALGRLLDEPGLGLVTAYALLRITGSGKAFERLSAGLRGQDPPEEVVRLLAKCDDPRIEALLLEAVALPGAGASVRPAALALLKERFWTSAEEKVLRIYLEEAKSAGVSEETLRELIGYEGAEVADRMLALLEVLQGSRWALAARVLAASGDPRAVRTFSRMRILEKDPGRRRLAQELYEEAQRRQAEIERERRRTSRG